MSISYIYNSVGQTINKVGKSITDFLPANTASYTAAQNTPVVKTVSPSKITDSLRYFESSNGMDPNTPRNQIRNYTIPPNNLNKQPRTVQYNSGYGGEFGLTPIALAELVRSKNLDPQDIQKQLMSVQGSGNLANLYFNRLPPKDFTPETLTNHYIENYVGKGTPSDTLQNRKRVLQYYQNIAQ